MSLRDSMRYTSCNNFWKTASNPPAKISGLFCPALRVSESADDRFILSSSDTLKDILAG